jgi:hypothetical protein
MSSRGANGRPTVAGSYADQMDLTMHLWHMFRDWYTNKFGNVSEARRTWLECLLGALAVIAVVVTVYVLLS